MNELHGEKVEVGEAEEEVSFIAKHTCLWSSLYLEGGIEMFKA